ncbi:MAG: GTPase HflX, partial [Candidatus Latescibacterota bacterium]
MTHSTEVPQESALLAGVVLPGVPAWEVEESLDELARLADTATLAIVDRVLQNRRRIDPTYYIGKGKAEELRDLASSRNADMIIFDNDLSPAQMRNLETLTNKRILDRS